MPEYVYKTIFQLKRGTSAEWEQVNPVLREGEPGFELDTGFLKIGDGVRNWQSLPYLATGDGGSGTEQGLVSYNRYADFPSVGDSRLIYRAMAEKALYQWNATTSTYESLSGTAVTSIPEIDFIVCGSSINIK